MLLRSAVVVAIVIALAGCGGDRQPTAAAAAPAEAPATAPTPNASAPAKTDKRKKVKEQSVDEFAQMRAELGLSADQEVTFAAKLAARDAAVKAWSEGPDGTRLEAAKLERTAAKDEAKRAELDTEIKRLNEGHWKVRTTYRAEVLQVLTLDQQRRWAGTRLGDRMVKVYGNLTLDEAQQAGIRAIAGEATNATLAEGDVPRDPYLAKVLDPARIEAERRIEAEVLTEAQRGLLAQRRAEKAEKKAEKAEKKAAAPAP